MFLKWKQPFRCMIAGPTSCGKSTFVVNLLKNREQCIEGDFEKILWCTGSNFTPPSIPGVVHHPGLPDADSFASCKSSLVILDDMMDRACNDSEISDLFTKTSHHNNVSVILICQNIFPKGSKARTIALNTRYFVLFKNPRDRQQIAILARQIFPSNWREFERVYIDCTKDPFGYCVLDFSQDTPDPLRITTKYFSDKSGATVYVPDPDQCLMFDKDEQVYTLK